MRVLCGEDTTIYFGKNIFFFFFNVLDFHLRFCTEFLIELSVLKKISNKYKYCIEMRLS